MIVKLVDEIVKRRKPKHATVLEDIDVNAAVAEHGLMYLPGTTFTGTVLEYENGGVVVGTVSGYTDFVGVYTEGVWVTIIPRGEADPAKLADLVVSIMEKLGVGGGEG